MMKTLRVALLRFLSFFKRDQQELELNNELETHLQLQIDDNLAHGMAPEEARRHALIRLGSPTQAKELYRDRRGFPSLETFVRDLRYAARTLRKTPAFTLIAIFILVLGIGANAAIYSVVDAVLLRKFPYKDPDHLVMIWEKNPQLGSYVGDRVPTAYKNFREWVQQSTSFAAIGGMEDANLNRTDGDKPEQIAGARVSANFFSVFSVQPALGTTFDFAASDSAHSHVVLLSDSYYQSHFGGHPGVTGQTLTLNDVIYTIVGVLPANFYLPATREGSEQRKPDLWIPYDVSNITGADLTRRKIQVFARLRPNVSIEQARAEMQIVAQRLQQEDPQLNTGFGAINIFPIYVEDVGQEMRRNLLVLLAAVGLVLLIACANLANLMLSRAANRRREFAVRTALGARPIDLLSQMLAESLLLSFIGAALGIAVAVFGIDALLALKPADILRPEQIHVNLPVVLFTAFLTIVSALIFGLIPGLQLLRADVNLALQSSGGAKVSAGSDRLRKALIVSEFAVAVVLLIGAAFMLKSLFAVMDVDPGFRPDHLLTMRLNLPPSRYPDNDSIARFCRAALEKVSAFPAVKSASFSDGLPMTRLRLMKFTVEGQPMPKPGGEPTADMRGITSPAYFDVLGLPIVAGRNFTADEVQQSRPVIVINQALARKLWPQENPVGKHLRIAPQKPGGEPVSLTVIGVVRDTHQFSLESGARPEITRPMVDYTILTLAVRTSSPPGSVTGAVENAIWTIDKDLPFFKISTMEQIVDDTMGQRRFNSLLMIAFAALALVLAAVGIYGVLSSAVAQRTREIGIRMALGARREDVTRMILRQGFRLIALGVTVGLLAGVALLRLLSSLLFGVRVTSVGTYAEVLAMMFAVGLVACYVPAARAVNVDPIIALRQE